MRHETGTPKILVLKLIFSELRVLVPTKRHVGSGNEIDSEMTYSILLVPLS